MKRGEDMEDRAPGGGGQGGREQGEDMEDLREETTLEREGDTGHMGLDGRSGGHGTLTLKEEQRNTKHRDRGQEQDDMEHRP